MSKSYGCTILAFETIYSISYEYSLSVQHAHLKKGTQIHTYEYIYVRMSEAIFVIKAF